MPTPKFRSDFQPSPEAKARGNQNRNYRNQILKKVMGLTVDEMYTKNEQEKLKYIYQKKINNKELKDCNVEELITHNLGKYCVNNGAMATAQNALSVIKHLCSPCFDELGDQLQLKLVLNNDEQKI